MSSTEQHIKDWFYILKVIFLNQPACAFISGFNCPDCKLINVPDKVKTQLQTESPNLYKLSFDVRY